MRKLTTLALALFTTVAAACGSTDGLAADAEPGAPDGDPTPDAEVRQAVTVTVLSFSDGDELDDVPVLFFDPDGTFVEEVATDNDGVAVAEIFAGGSVVAMYPNEKTVTGGADFIPIVTLDVSGGANLRIGAFVAEDETEATITADTEGAATDYDLTTDCGGAPQSSSEVTPTWVQSITCDRASFAVVASDLDGPFAVAYVPDVEVDTEIDLDTDYEDVDNADLLITGFPEDATTASSDVYAQLPGIKYFGEFMTSAPYEDDSGELELDGGFPDLDDALMFTAFSYSVGSQGQTVLDVRPQTDELDVSALLLEGVEDLDFDAGDLAIRWDEDEPGAVNFGAGLVGGTVDGVGIQWIYSGRPTDGELVLPVLPDDYEDYNLEDAEETGAQLYATRLSDSIIEGVAADPILSIFGGLVGLIPNGEGTAAIVQLSFSDS